jgi:hypothetical protein
MSNRNRLAVAVMLFSALSAAGAQQSYAPAAEITVNNLRVAAARAPPVSKPKGPTLEFTMEYIQDRLISRGILNYKVSLHDTATGKDWSYEFTDKLSGTYANPSTCQIGFHWKQTRSGEAVTDKETYLDLTGGAKADVLTMDQYLTESAAKSGHDSWSAKVSPSLFVLHITKSDNSESNFVFPDEDTATHLSKALMHAAGLCGSAQGAGTPPAGDKEPF